MRLCLLMLIVLLVACGNEQDNYKKKRETLENTTEVPAPSVDDQPSSNDDSSNNEANKGLVGSGDEQQEGTEAPSETVLPAPPRTDVPAALVGLWKPVGNDLGLAGKFDCAKHQANIGYLEISQNGQVKVHDYMDDECTRASQCYWRSEEYLVDEVISDTALTLKVKGGIHSRLKLSVSPASDGDFQFNVENLIAGVETEYSYRREKAITAIDLSPDCRDTILPKKDSFDTLRALLDEVKNTPSGSLNNYFCPGTPWGGFDYQGVDSFLIYTGRLVDRPFSFSTQSSYALDLMAGGQVHQRTFSMALNRTVVPYEWCIFGVLNGHLR